MFPVKANQNLQTVAGTPRVSEQQFLRCSYLVCRCSFCKKFFQPLGCCNEKIRLIWVAELNRRRNIKVPAFWFTLQLKQDKALRISRNCGRGLGAAKGSRGGQHSMVHKFCLWIKYGMWRRLTDKSVFENPWNPCRAVFKKFLRNVNCLWLQYRRIWLFNPGTWKPYSISFRKEKGLFPPNGIHKPT